MKALVAIGALGVIFVLLLVVKTQGEEIKRLENVVVSLRSDNMLLRISNISYEQYIQEKQDKGELIEITVLENEKNN